MKFFSRFKKNKKSTAKPKEVVSSTSQTTEKESSKPQKVFHNFPEHVDMDKFSIAGVYRIDLLIVISRTTGENNPFDGYELLYDVLLPEGVINVPLVLLKDGKKYGVFAFYKEEEAANFKKFRSELLAHSGFTDCFYVSLYNPEKYEISDGAIEMGTTFTALFKIDKEATDETFEGHYAQWWSTAEDPHFGSSPCRKHYHTIYENMVDYESVFVGMLSSSLNKSDELSRVLPPDNEMLVYVTGPENKKVVISLSKEKGLRFLLQKNNTSTQYRERLLKVIAKSIKFLNQGFKEREIPKDPKNETSALDHFNFLSSQIDNAKIIADAIGRLTIGNPPEEDAIFDKVIKPERIVIRMKINYGDDAKYEPSKINLTEAQSPKMIPFHEDLLLGIAQDFGHSYAFVNNEEFDKLEMSEEEIINIGLNNIIKEVGENIKIQGNPEESYILIACGGNHEMALLAMDSFWSSMADLFKSDFCVCFPVRDILLASNFYNAKGMDGLRASIKKFYFDPEQPHKMSNGIYLRKENAWKLIERVEVE